MIDNWNDSYAWGNHASAGYLTAVTFLQLTDTPASYSGQAGKLAAVNSSANAIEFIDKPVGIVSKGVSTTGSGSFVPGTTDNYSTPTEIFRNAPYQWTTSNYAIGRVIEVNLSGDCTIPTGITTTFTLDISGTKYCPIEIDGSYTGKWSIRYLLTVRTSTDIRLSGTIVGKNVSDANTTNETVGMNANHDITIYAQFSANNASNAISSNLIYAIAI